MKQGNELFTPEELEKLSKAAAEPKEPNVIRIDNEKDVIYYSPLASNSLFSQSASAMQESHNPRRNLSVFDYELPDLQRGFSYKGNETRVKNMQTSSKSIPPGFKEMTVWDEEVQDFWRKIVPEDTPELTDEEFQRYSAINPQ